MFLDESAYAAFWDAQVSYDDVKNPDFKHQMLMGQRAVIGTIFNMIGNISMQKKTDE